MVALARNPPSTLAYPFTFSRCVPGISRHIPYPELLGSDAAVRLDDTRLKHTIHIPYLLKSSILVGHVQ